MEHICLRTNWQLQQTNSECVRAHVSGFTIKKDLKRNIMKCIAAVRMLCSSTDCKHFLVHILKNYTIIN